MKPTTLLSTLVLAFLLIGCAGSRPPTTPTTSDSPAPSNSAAPDTTTQASDSPPPAPSRAPQDWYHLDRVPRSGPGLDTRAAYRDVLQGRPPQDTVQVAVIDSGLDIDHEDLAAKLWTNADEIPGNDVDDDGNGYVDDVHGWNFIGGPDGKNVDQDTYELTRIYVDLQERFAGVDSARVSPDARDRYRRYQDIKRTFQKKRREARKRLAKVGKAQKAVQASVDVLKSHLGTDSLTQSAVRSVTSSRRDVRRAQQTLQYFYDQDLSPSDLKDYKNQLERQVEYNYNPDFNPRPIVGDDYADKTERRYGNNDAEGPDPGHGTHVAGIIGATRDNSIGIDGVARGVRLMSVRAVPNGDERDKDVANAIRYAVDNGADVINMSFGKSYSPHKDVVDAAVQYADSMGVLMVHAAGNDGANVDSTDNFPSPYYADGGRAQRWIEVGASSWEGGEKLAASFSNYGAERVDVFAPGHSIYSTVPDDAYERNDGTSMAAPMVSGLAALIMAYYPSLTATDVRTIILETATPYRNRTVARPGDGETVPFGTLSDTGAVVNAYAALQRAADRVAAR
ncbi:S8 family peptidase [Salinibacter ruber]|uniref:Subtilisin family serine protease n=1 Tax=Salinibacter ruber TaxID=146919 RepID=A0A9X2UN36_9BACT|nr:S8 family peptidase [Salinibacter ruber]MCS3613055.1 subtilisin family serine protease [Salinibacter ruber]MCS3616275.1 subtilisin family serine protease [Salinibacter ruber]MCS3675595.1 subtilisin family serine protease [Salinibacter ruber]MCS3783538.1 subtilisin family serine protease [Salinibacter ruber]MCS4037562.1 subtilisin family serine protease [Salinibacter ruber]